MLLTRRAGLPLALALVCFATGGAQAGPCTAALDALQPKVDAAVETAAAKGGTAVEGDTALESKQPTPDSIAAAEAKLGEGEAARKANAAMAEARAADAAGNGDACQAAIATINAALGP